MLLAQVMTAKSPTHILQISSVQIIYVIGFIRCYIVKAW